MDRFERFYGDRRPLHLLILLVSFAVAAYAVVFVSHAPMFGWVVVWFVVAVVAHDLILFPLYTAADRALGPARRASPVPLVNHVRVPALGAGLLFLLFLPGILARGTVTFRAATGQTQNPFLERYLLIVVALFVLSGIVYAVRLVRARRRAREPAPEG